MMIYHIAGYFGNLANWRMCEKSSNLKPPSLVILHYAYATSINHRQILKLTNNIIWIRQIYCSPSFLESLQIFIQCFVWVCK